MIYFPNIDPVIISIGPINVYWYSIAYIAGILFGWYYSCKLVEKFPYNITKKNLEDFVSWAIIGIILGGRLGYVIFYNPVKYFQHPIHILKTYEGGMSFHGGLIGLIISAYIFCRKHKLYFIQLIDLMAVVAPIGLLLGRIGNFINGELYGRVTDVKWAVIFPNSDMQPRHPSQLYEAFLEGLLLYIIMLIAIFRYNTFNNDGKTSGIFLVFYSLFRIFIEFFREPDFHIGFILMDFTLGQILSIPMLFIGLYLIFLSKCQFIQK